MMSGFSIFGEVPENRREVFAGEELQSLELTSMLLNSSASFRVSGARERQDSFESRILQLWNRECRR